MNLLTEHLNNVINKSWNFAGRLTTPEQHQQNAMVGLASEAGELLDIGKKMWFHSTKSDGFYREKMVSELGDVVYYLLKVLDVFNISLEEVVAYNKLKLQSRHPELGVVTERFGKDAIRG